MPFTSFSIMNQLLILLVLGAAFVNAEEEPFSIGLGVLSPSYSQTVGDEKVKVKFDQKENGAFSYSVGNPVSGSNSFLSFGGSAGIQQPDSAGYAASGSPYNSAAGYPAPAPASAGHAAPAYQGTAGYAAPAYQGAAGYAAPAPSYNTYSAPAPAYNGYSAPAPAPAYNAYSSPTAAHSGAPGYAAAAPSYNGASGHNAPGPVYNGYSGYNRPSPQANGLFENNYQAAARKPQEETGNILPAGFSYHATDGQAFLGSMGESPTFMVEDSPQSSRGPAEQSFYRNSGNQPGLVNGQVGYGHGRPAREALPIGGYAGPQFQGAHREHGGHN